jgi:hypothetical protein
LATVLTDFVGGQVLERLHAVHPDLKCAATGIPAEEVMTSVSESFSLSLRL